jgi:hypothetical protein
VRINQVEDKYWVFWPAHILTAQDAKRWCWETFGSSWGSMKLGVPDNQGTASNILIFHRLAHAHWFLLKWNID